MKRLTALGGALVIALTTLTPSHTRAATIEYTGTYELTVSITAGGTFTTGQSVYCMFVVIDSGDASGNDYRGVGIGTTTLSSTGTATSTASIPYTWALSTPASNHVKPSFACVLLPEGKTEAALAVAGLRLTDLPIITGVPTKEGSVTQLTAKARL